MITTNESCVGYTKPQFNHGIYSKTGYSNGIQYVKKQNMPVTTLLQL